MVKRYNSSLSRKMTKKQRIEEPKQSGLEAQSAVEEAKPYLLVTAKFPIDALTPEWSLGVNRSINTQHKQRLYRNFIEQGVLRNEQVNRLRIACTKVEVQQMLDYVGHGKEQSGEEWPFFKDWMVVNNGRKAELLAGNHRVEALKEYLQDGNLEEERWWICDLYDKGKQTKRTTPNFSSKYLANF